MVITGMWWSLRREPIPSSYYEWSATDDAAFRSLQERLREVWPTITMRTLARVNRTVVIVPSISFEVPHYLAPVFPAYEERFLFFVPVYGPNPSLAHFGTKSGCRRLFAEEGVPHPFGVEDVSGLDELVSAIDRIRRERPATQEVVVKLNKGVSGLGNGVVHIDGAKDRATLAERVHQIRLEDQDADTEAFFGALGEEGGIVEERNVGDSIRSPSVQMRCGPCGEYEVGFTHDQLLGGPHGQSFLGCRFPADQAYGRLIVAEALKIGARLAREGVVGRYGIDFVVTQSLSGQWKPYAIEINLRNGGTTHPFLTLSALTDGDYDPQTNEFRSATGQAKYYVATDHLEAPEYARLTPDDLLDLVPRRALLWQSGLQTGIAFYMISALAVAGRVGLTAIGDTPGQAEELYAWVRNVMDEESGRNTT